VRLEQAIASKPHIVCDKSDDDAYFSNTNVGSGVASWNVKLRQTPSAVAGTWTDVTYLELKQ